MLACWQSMASVQGEDAACTLPCPEWRVRFQKSTLASCRMRLEALVSWRLVYEASSSDELSKLYLCTLHGLKQSWRFCRPYLLPCLVVAIFGLATGAFCVVYMPETLPEAQVQRSSELLPKWLQPRSDYQALMSEEAESPLMGVKPRRPPRPSKHTAAGFVLAGDDSMAVGWG